MTAIHHKAVLYTFCYAFCTILLTSCGQSDHITGTVKDVFGDPIEGVQVSVENTGFGAKTAANGTYDLDYAPGKIVVGYSKEGFEPASLAVEIHQKVKFPAKEITLYPLPQTKGIFWIDKTKKRLVELQENYKVKEVEQVTGVMERNVKYLAWPDVDVLNQDIPNGKVEFLDNTTNAYKLHSIKKNNVVLDINQNPMGVKTNQGGDIKESVSRISETAIVRSFELSQGPYSWIRYSNNLLGQSTPLTNSKSMMISVAK